MKKENLSLLKMSGILAACIAVIGAGSLFVIMTVVPEFGRITDDLKPAYEISLTMVNPNDADARETVTVVPVPEGRDSKGGCDAIVPRMLNDGPWPATSLKRMWRPLLKEVVCDGPNDFPVSYKGETLAGLWR